MTAVLVRGAAERPDAGARPGRARRIAEIAAVAAPGTAAATWLHFHRARPMTMDESFTVLTSARTWWSFVRGCTTDVHMALYYGVLKLWSFVAGTGLGALRMFSLVSFAAMLVGIAVWTTSRRRRWSGMLAGIALALTPMFREATIDARAAAFAAAIAVWLVVGFDRWLGDEGWPRRRVAVLLVGSVAAALSHPSTLFVGLAGIGLVWRFARSEADHTVRRWCLVALPVVGMSGLVAASQSSSAESVSAEGLDALGSVLSQLPGASLLAGTAFVATVALLVIGRAFDDERIVRWFAGSALVWSALCTVALPFRNVLVPRYFAAVAALAVLGLVAARREDWSKPVILVTVALIVVGGISRLDRDHGFGSEWCALSERFAEEALPGDSVVFASSAYASPVVVCLGERGEAVLRSMHRSPELSDADLRDPRTMWMSVAPPAEALWQIPDAGTLWFVTAPGAHPAVDDATAELASVGARCETHAFEGLALTGCANP